MSKSLIQGSIYSDRFSGLLFIEITSPALGHFKYPFDGKTFKTDVLTGIYSFQEYNIEETLGQEAVNLINKGEKLQIEADVDMFVCSGYRGQLEVNDYPSVWIKNASFIEE